MADKDYDSSDDEEKTIADDVVVTKYKQDWNWMSSYKHAAKM